MTRTWRAAGLSLILAGACAAPVFAQQLKPLPQFVFDVRGFSTKLAQDATTASDLGGVASDLPSRAWGVSFGAHAYPLRSNGLALGIGVEVMSAGAKSKLVDAQQQLIATIDEHVLGASGVVSLNFGHHEGWSYLSAGAGPLRFNTFASTVPSATPPGKMTVNVGGGGRWFTTPHIAFEFDVRVYLAKAIASTLTTPGRGAHHVTLISVGVGIK